MNDQKDNKIMMTRQDSLSDINPNIYSFINKKTEKLITALYMVTDCMDFDDALKTKLRSLGVELLSDMHRFSTLSIIEKHTHINTSIARVNETITFIDIASTIGFISDMNAGILKREFSNLITELESHLSEKQQLSFILDKGMFDIPRPIEEFKRTIYNGHSIGQNKRQERMSFTKHDQPSQSKEERINKILELLTSKVDLSTGQAGVSIKDISTSFTNCSEKTIQRELNDLVLKGKLTKTGSKRWSRYSFT